MLRHVGFAELLLLLVIAVGIRRAAQIMEKGPGAQMRPGVTSFFSS